MSAGEIKLLSPTDNRAYVLVDTLFSPDSIGFTESLVVIRFDGAGRLTPEGSTFLGSIDVETPGVMAPDSKASRQRASTHS